MKKIFIFIVSLFFTLPVLAIEEINYKNIEEGSKVAVINSSWTLKIPKETKIYFIKRVSQEDSKLSEFYSADGKIYFSTGCHYDFIHKGNLIGYSNYEMKFYEFSFNDGDIERRELLYQEVQELFPTYKIVKISDFSTKTNSLIVKKGKKKLKIIVLNDTDKYFYNYDFITNNSKFDRYYLKGFISVKKKGMIHLSRIGENSKNSPWYVLLVR